jgi:hypothetical protein
MSKKFTGYRNMDLSRLQVHCKSFKICTKYQRLKAHYASKMLSQCYFQKLFIFEIVLQFPNKILICHLTTFCFCCSVGKWYNYKELVFCMEGKILPGYIFLHFATLTRHIISHATLYTVVQHIDSL